MQEMLKRPVPAGSLADRAANLAGAIRTELDERAPGLLAAYPVESYLSLFDEAPRMTQYYAAPPDARTFQDAIEERGGAEALEAYHRLAMAQRIADGIPDGEVRLTPEIIAKREIYLHRVVKDIAKGNNGFFRFGNIRFAKDFAVCRGRVIPCGVEVLDPRDGVPRSFLLKSGPWQFFKGLKLIGRLGGIDSLLKGIRPLWGLHFDRRQVRDFNDAGYTELYLRVADLLALNPNVKGVMSWSWWHDPTVARISPELSFVARHPESAGAITLRADEGEVFTADALHFAPKRLALYREGAYRPRAWILVWARRDLLRWAHDWRGKSGAGNDAFVSGPRGIHP